jgi:hypothetical protein
MPRVNLRRFGLALFVVAWIGALTYSVTAGGTSPERLDDPTARTVESNCESAQRALGEVPQLGEHSTVADTATRLDRENRILTGMVHRQLAVHPAKKTPATALRAWLGDWQRLITAREHYANELRTKGRDARFIEPAYKGVDPIADKMNDWILEQGTRTNTCNTDALQGEVVNGPRRYKTPASK